LEEASDRKLWPWPQSGRGVFVSVPVFDGASEGEIKELLEKAGLPTTAKPPVRWKKRESRSSEDTVGYMYLSNCITS